MIARLELLRKHEGCHPALFAIQMVGTHVQTRKSVLSEKNIIKTEKEHNHEKANERERKNTKHRISKRASKEML